MTDKALLAELGFLQNLMSMGYERPKPIGNGKWAALTRFMFTSAIIVGRMHDTTGYEDRWCYHTMEDALRAFDSWDGSGEPDGWHRHPGTGRRRENGDEYINF